MIRLHVYSRCRVLQTRQGGVAPPVVKPANGRLVRLPGREVNPQRARLWQELGTNSLLFDVTLKASDREVPCNRCVLHILYVLGQLGSLVPLMFDQRLCHRRWHSTPGGLRLQQWPAHYVPLLRIRLHWPGQAFKHLEDTSIISGIIRSVKCPVAAAQVHPG